MFGISYGELFLLVGATAALIGPKDLPMIARTAGRLAGRAVGYVQLARGQFENVMQQSQARQVHKELQDTMAQLEAIRHEIRSISIMNPGPLTKRLVDDPELRSANKGDSVTQKLDGEHRTTETISEECSSTVPTAECGSATSVAADLESQATAFAKLAESQILNDSSKSSNDLVKPGDETGLLTVLPVSAESAGLLPHRRDDAKGSDIMLEAVVEAEVAQNAKQFFAQQENLIKFNEQDERKG